MKKKKIDITFENVVKCGLVGILVTTFFPLAILVALGWCVCQLYEIMKEEGWIA